MSILLSDYLSFTLIFLIGLSIYPLYLYLTKKMTLKICDFELQIQNLEIVKNDLVSKIRENISLEKDFFYEKEKNSKIENEKLIIEKKLHETKEIFEINQREFHSLKTENKFLLQEQQTYRESLEEQKKQMKCEFENISSKLFEEKSKIFQEQSTKGILHLIDPLKEKILAFEKTVDSKFGDESKERHLLKHEIQKLIELSDKMTTETHSLTLALKCDSKTQGDWGEIILERILETSGLRENVEFSKQMTVLGEDHEIYRPDVIIHLPDSKHLIIDSKVSLKSYELYRSANSEDIKEKHLQDFLKSIERHIDELGKKHYYKTNDLKSPDLVLLFIPLESAYFLAMQQNLDLLGRAWKKNISIVTSTTLFTHLKCIYSIWKLENQQKNANQIALEAGKLYDKFVGFIDDFEKIGSIFQQGSNHFDLTLNKLKLGKGNIINRIEHLKILGASPTKQLREDLLDFN